MTLTFIVKHPSNGNFATITMLVVCRTDTNGNQRYFYFWQKSNESRTRYIGEYGAHDYNDKALIEVCSRCEGNFVGWVTPGIPEPTYIDKRNPDGVAI